MVFVGFIVVLCRFYSGFVVGFIVVLIGFVVVLCGFLVFFWALLKGLSGVIVFSRCLEGKSKLCKLQFSCGAF